MSEKIKAITLNHIKYGDTSLILHVFSENYGYMSLLFKGFYNKKNKVQLCKYPFTPIEFSANSNVNKDKLISIFSIEILNFYDKIYSHPIKMLQTQLIAELMSNILKEEPGNKYLIDNILNNLKDLENREKNFADFHLFFIKDIAQQLGLQPNLSNINGKFFNLKESQFLDDDQEDLNLDLETSSLMRNLFNTDYKSENKNIFNQNQRNILLNTLIKYFEYHLPNFKKPKSLEILKQLLN